MNCALLRVVIRIQVHHILAFASFAFLTRRLGKEREYRSVAFRGRRLSLWHRVQTRHSFARFKLMLCGIWVPSTSVIHWMSVATFLAATLVHQLAYPRLPLLTLTTSPSEREPPPAQTPDPSRRPENRPDRDPHRGTQSSVHPSEQC